MTRALHLLVGVGVGGAEDLGCLDASRIVVLVAERVDALGASVGTHVQALLERIHARVDLQHAATVAGRARGSSRARYAQVMLVGAHAATGAAADTRVVSELVLFVLLAAAEQEEDQQADEGDTSEGADHYAGNGAAAEARAVGGDGLIVLARVIGGGGGDDDGLSGNLTANSHRLHDAACSFALCEKWLAFGLQRQITRNSNLLQTHWV